MMVDGCITTYKIISSCDKEWSFKMSSRLRQKIAKKFSSCHDDLTKALKTRPTWTEYNLLYVHTNHTPAVSKGRWENCVRFWIQWRSRTEGCSPRRSWSGPRMKVAPGSTSSDLSSSPVVKEHPIDNNIVCYHPNVVAECRWWWGRGQGHLGGRFTLHLKSR